MMFVDSELKIVSSATRVCDVQRRTNDKIVLMLYFLSCYYKHNILSKINTHWSQDLKPYLRTNLVG